MASKSFQFIADTINGVIQEFPAPFYFPCDQIVPLGVQIVRDFDDDLCIVAKRVYVIRYGQDLFGSSSFNSLTGFLQYMKALCNCCPTAINCDVLFNGCALLFNGCEIQLGGCRGNYTFIMNGCDITINGCTVYK